jgi:hypothetical protein
VFLLYGVAYRGATYSESSAQGSCPQEREMGKKYGFSFSPKRALGISAAKGKISRATGIPLSRSGRQRKIGRAAGCLLSVTIFFTLLMMATLAVAHHLLG